jgi:hypothetical protein
LAFLGAVLASSWPCLGSLSRTWPHLGPSLGLLGSWVLFWGSTRALFGFSWGSPGLSWAPPIEVAPTTAATAAALKAAVADSGLHYLWAGAVLAALGAVLAAQGWCFDEWSGSPRKSQSSAAGHAVSPHGF